MNAYLDAQSRNIINSVNLKQKKEIKNFKRKSIGTIWNTESTTNKGKRREKRSKIEKGKRERERELISSCKLIKCKKQNSSLKCSRLGSISFPVGRKYSPQPVAPNDHSSVQVPLAIFIIYTYIHIYTQSRLRSAGAVASAPSMDPPTMHP